MKLDVTDIVIELVHNLEDCVDFIIEHNEESEERDALLARVADNMQDLTVVMAKKLEEVVDGLE